MKLLLCICFLSIAVSAMAEQDVDQILQDGNNKFTAKMFNEVANANKEKSIVLSAYSVMPPLAQLALASVGESHDELLNAIGMPNDNVTKAAFSSANSKLRSTKGVTLQTASKIYVAQNYELNNEFAAVSRDTFGSEVKNVDFSKNAEVAAEVNAWVEDQTNHRIKDLVDPDALTPDTKALLVNAIYFKGTWKIPFQTYATRDKDFHVTKNKVIKVPTMYNKDTYNYTESKELNAQILEIPYEGDEASCVFVLPREVDGIDELAEKLRDPTALDKAMSNMHEIDIEVYLPKFKIETTTDLKDILQKMEIQRLFSPKNARLDNLLKHNSNLYIDSALQKAFIEINEEGAEAAAANVIGIVGASIVIDPIEPPVFKADRPFYFAIRTNSMTLFNGIKREE
ncbi:alaserpin-like isoform X1 [Vanessa atalanta]|uniref:alaserpin-like isoform X1 n=1 Tax=Vanessa atalanta TaxID=42275 RepID=UPI001FCD5CE0|nr:alaserpin-like isoform X1 [Vanessa atalanta]